MTASDEVRLSTALQELHKLYPDWRFGQLIANIATWAKGPVAEAIWDVTDEELLHAAEEHLRKHLQPASVLLK